MPVLALLYSLPTTNYPLVRIFSLKQVFCGIDYFQNYCLNDSSLAIAVDPEMRPRLVAKAIAHCH
jgi:hypothetical protein